MPSFLRPTLMAMLFTQLPFWGSPQNLIIQNGRSGAPIPYCNVKVLDKGFGKVAGKAGELTFPDSLLNRMSMGDSVQISAVGYWEKKLSKKVLMGKLEHRGKVTLTRKPIEKGAVTVHGYEKKDVLLGKRSFNNVNQIGFGVANNTGNGYQMGTVIEVRRPFTELDTFGFYVTKVSYYGDSMRTRLRDTVRCRLNLYDHDEGANTVSEKVDTLINDSLIIFELPVEKGPFKLDLSEHELTVHGDLLATIEALEKTSEEPIMIHFSARSFGGKGYSTFGIGRKWREKSFGSIALFFKGKMPTWRESRWLKEKVPKE
ncbi:MAG: hypothetical protein ABEH38_08125 [Flavobacteriales bacterium]